MKKCFGEILEFDKNDQGLTTAGGKKIFHCFEQESLRAINAAFCAGRPLLLAGEPGVGKSQLALAVACALKIPFYHKVIDERIEREELFFQYDAVSRLAEAQMAGAICSGDKGASEDVRGNLEVSKFLRPETFWWAFNPENAKDTEKKHISQKQGTSQNKSASWTEYEKRGAEHSECDGPTCIVLIDEIDKADISVPNGLLECLANKSFYVPHTGETIYCQDDMKPLILITTNGEKDLPPAFIRRCFVHTLSFPKIVQCGYDSILDENTEAVNFLLERARVRWSKQVMDDAIIKDAARYLIRERLNPEMNMGYTPGVAEFIDILEALNENYPGDFSSQKTMLDEIYKFALIKDK